MAIARLTAYTKPPTSDADWSRLSDKLDAVLLGLACPYRVDWTNGLIKKGAVFMISGTTYLTDADYTITGTPSNFIKVLPSGDGSTCSASYAASLAGVTWNTTYNGYYDAGSPASIYLFDEHNAYAKGEITQVRGNRDFDILRQERINIGAGNTAQNAGNIAIGGVNVLSDTGSVAVGLGNGLTGQNAYSIGTNNSSTADETITIGNSLSVDSNNEAAIGFIRYVRYPIGTRIGDMINKFLELYAYPGAARLETCLGKYGTSAIASVEVRYTPAPYYVAFRDVDGTLIDTWSPINADEVSTGKFELLFLIGAV